MVEPTVCCVMLTRDRPAMAARAVAAFRAQTYERKKLLVYDNGGLCDGFGCGTEIFHVTIGNKKSIPIGTLRNAANAFSSGYGHNETEFIAHWDSDDWSHPNRLAEQVALLQASGADCVGYNEALCWDTRRSPSGRVVNEAWLYANHVPPTYALGGSFCYWRKAWEAHPFDAISQGEDERFRTKVKCVGVSSIDHIARGLECSPVFPFCTQNPPQGEPRFIIGVHGGNTSPYNMVGHPASFRRSPEWDAYCQERMKL